MKSDDFLENTELHFQTDRSLRHMKPCIKTSKLLAISIILTSFRYISPLSFLNHYHVLLHKINDTPNHSLHTQTNGRNGEITNHGNLRWFATTIIDVSFKVTISQHSTSDR